MVISVVLLKTEQSMAAQVCKCHLNKIKTYAVEKTVIQISSGRSHEQKKEMDVFNFSDKVTFVWNTRKSALVEKFLWQEKAVWYGTFFFSWSNLPTEKVSMVFSRLQDTEPVSSFPWQKNRWKAMARMTKTETVHD